MKKFWSVLAAATMLVACKEEAPVQGIVSPDVIYATVDEDGTRTYVDGTGENVRMHWTAGDAVAAFFSSYGEKYVFQGETGDRGGSFAKEGSGFTTGFEIDRNYAVYPYTQRMMMDEEGTVTLTLPSTQTYAEGSFGLGAGVMTSVTSGKDDTHFVFKNAVGFLKLQIYGGGTVKSILFKGNNSEKLAGTATLSIPYGENPTMEVTGEGTELTLSCGDGVVTAEEKADATSFWFAIPPQTFEAGFTVEVTDGAGKVTTKRLSRSFEIERNMVSPMTPFELAGQAPEPPAPEIPDLPAWPYTDSRLPVLYVYTPDNVAITSKENWVTESHAYLREPDGSAEGKITDLGTANIRWRGNSTLSYMKKAYALKLDTKASLLGMPSDKRWDLLANYIDRTRLRNDIALEMGRRLDGLDWTPKGEFVELYLNGVHMGNYYLVEHIKVGKKRVPITEMKAGDTDLSGGYLLEMSTEMDEPYQFWTNYFTRWALGAQYRLPVMVKSPEDEDMDQEKLAWIQDFINSVQSNVIGGNAAWHDQVDMDSFVDWMLVQEITGNYEPFHPKSCYMHKDRGGKLMMGPLWDFDYGTFLSSGSNSTGTYVSHYSIWYGSMIQDAAFKAKVRERWPAVKEACLAVANELPDGEDASWMNLLVSIDRDWVRWRMADTQHQTTYNKDENLGIWVAIKRIKDNIIRRVNQFDQIEIPNNY